MCQLLLVLVHCVSIQLQNKCTCQEILEHFRLLSAHKLYGDADFLFQQELAPTHNSEGCY